MNKFIVAQLNKRITAHISLYALFMFTEIGKIRIQDKRYWSCLDLVVPETVIARTSSNLLPEVELKIYIILIGYYLYLKFNENINLLKIT